MNEEFQAAWNEGDPEAGVVQDAVEKAEKRAKERDAERNKGVDEFVAAYEVDDTKDAKA